MNHDLSSFIHFWTHAWDWDESKIIGCLFLCISFAIWTRFESVARSVIYLSGVVILFVSLASPLDALSDQYLFSAHMLQHILLLMVVPPLLIIGLPRRAAARLMQHPSVKSVEAHLSNPWFAWIIGNLVLWIWHIPYLYDWTVESEALHIFEHLTFLVSATIFWWPVLQPDDSRRLEFARGLVYLVSAALSNMGLGVLLTFTSVPLYRVYLDPIDTWKILPILRGDFRLTPLTDQKFGGVMMWVVGGFIFLGIILNEVARWYRAEVTQERAQLETA